MFTLLLRLPLQISFRYSPRSVQKDLRQHTCAARAVQRGVKLPGEASTSLGKPCSKRVPQTHTHTHTPSPNQFSLFQIFLPASLRQSGIPLLPPPGTLRWGSAVSHSGSAPPCVPASERSAPLPHLCSLGGKGFRNTREETSQSEGTDRLLKRVRLCERSK